MSFTVTATGSNSGGQDVFDAAIQVIVLTGASTAAQPGATAEDNSYPGHTYLLITPEATGSVIYGGVIDYTDTAHGAYDSNTVLEAGSPWYTGDPADVYGGFFHSAGATTEGSGLTLGFSDGGSDTLQHAIVLCEILAGDGTIAEDASSTALARVDDAPALSLAVTTDSFDPPAGSLLVALVYAAALGNNADTSAVLSDTSGLGLTWVQQAPETLYGPGYVGVWTAQTPSDDPPDPTLDSTQTLTLTANTETHLDSTTTRYELIAVENNGDDPVFVCTDGGTATVGGDSCLAVLPGETLGFGNLLPLGNADVPGQLPGDGWTAQAYVEPSTGFMTYVSLISEADASVAVAVY